MLSDQALKEFKEIYRLEFGQEIDDETATALAINTLTFYSNIYRPVKVEWSDKLK